MKRQVLQWLGIATGRAGALGSDKFGIPNYHLTLEGTLVNFNEPIAGAPAYGAAEPENTIIHWYMGVQSRNGYTSVAPVYFRPLAFHQSAVQFNHARFYLSTLHADTVTEVRRGMRTLREAWRAVGLYPHSVILDCVPGNDPSFSKRRDHLFFEELGHWDNKLVNVTAEAGLTDAQLEVAQYVPAFQRGGVLFQYTAGHHCGWTGLYDLSRYKGICPITVWLDVPQNKPYIPPASAKPTAAQPRTVREALFGDEDIVSIAETFRQMGLPQVPNGDAITDLAVSDTSLTKEQIKQVFGA